VEQGLIPPWSTSVHSRFLMGGSCCPIFSFLFNCLFIVVCPFLLILLAIVLSVLLHLITPLVSSNFSCSYFSGFAVCTGRAGLKPNGPIAHNWARARIIYSRLFKYTQHNAVFTENSNDYAFSWGPHLMRPILCTGLCKIFYLA